MNDYLPWLAVALMVGLVVLLLRPRSPPTDTHQRKF
jgi:hypothetical protein